MPKTIFIIFFTIASFSAHAMEPLPGDYTYAVVISKTAYADAGWKAVADSLMKKHQANSARLFTWTSSVTEVKSGLSEFMPGYIGYIARPASECNSKFIVAISQMTRALDSDNYVDAAWGVITGYTASDALRAISESIKIKTVIMGSNDINYEPPLMRYYQGIGLPCESYTKTDYLFANKGGRVYSVEARPDGAEDRTNLVCKWLNADTLNVPVTGQGTISGSFDCLITGGHGNVNVWQMHYSDAGVEGYIESSKGQLYGAPYSGGTVNINSPIPKVFWCLSNCLMGCPDDSDNFVYAAFHTGHAVQMFGFVPEAHTGDEFMAWGMYDRITKFAGSYTLARGFFTAQNNSVFESLHSTGQFSLTDVKGYLDSCAFYGDPAANVTFVDFGDTVKPYTEKLTYAENTQGTSTFTYTITTTRQALGFGQGYCYAFRPVCPLPVRIDASTISIVKNEGRTADITDNLVAWELLSSGETMDSAKTRTLTWTAKTIGQTGANSNKISRPAQPAGIDVSMLNNNRGMLLRYRNIPAGPAGLYIVNMSGRKVFSSTVISTGAAEQFSSVYLCPGPGIYFAVLKYGNTSIKERIVLAD